MKRLALRETHVGDCRELLKRIAPNSIDCVCTSPPYWGLRDYGAAGQLGLESSPGEYVAELVRVFRLVRRALKPSGTVWLNLGDSYISAPRGSASPETSTLEGRASIGAPLDKRGYRGDRLANGRGDSPAIHRVKTRGLRDGSHAGKHTAMTAAGPMVQPNRFGIPGFKAKDMAGIPWRVALALQADGWWLRSDIIWAKPNPMPEAVQDRPTRAHEYVFLLTKSEHYYYDAAAIREAQVAPEASTAEDAARAFTRRRQRTIDPDQPEVDAEQLARKRSGNKTRTRRVDAGGVESSPMHQAFGVPWEDTDGMRNKRSVWTIATEPYAGAHFATFPTALVQPCVLAGCPMGGVVLDPFGGSGTVGQVAEDLGRKWIAIEINAEYAALARVRTRQRGLFVEASSP